jgi:hypothetical protein
MQCESGRAGVSSRQCRSLLQPVGALGRARGIRDEHDYHPWFEGPLEGQEALAVGRRVPQWRPAGGSDQSERHRFSVSVFDEAGRKRLLPMGSYDASGERGLTLVSARTRASEWSALYRSGVHDLHGHFERQREAEDKARDAARAAAARVAAETQHGTLRQLLDTYVAHLNPNQKTTVSDVRSLFATHLIAPFPELVQRKAAAVLVDEFVDLIGRVVAAGKGRTAARFCFIVECSRVGPSETNNKEHADVDPCL